MPSYEKPRMTIFRFMDIDFVLFSTTHIVTIGIFILVGALIFQLGQFWLGSPNQQGKINGLLVGLVLLAVLLPRGVSFILEEFSFATDLPIHICGVAPILLIGYLMFPGSALFNILFYWILSGGVLAFVFPTIDYQFPSTEFIFFFVSHGVPFMVLLYLIRARGACPAVHGPWQAFFALNLYAIVVAMPINQMIDANYLYLSEVPTLDLSLIYILPPWPWYLIIFDAFVLWLFLIIGRAIRSRVVTDNGV